MLPQMASARRMIVTLLVGGALALSACGGSDNSGGAEAEVRDLGERFATKVGIGDYQAVCGTTFSDSLRRSFEEPALGTSCEDYAGTAALGSPALKGLFVGDVEVQGDHAVIRFKDSAVYARAKDEAADGWRITDIAE